MAVASRSSLNVFARALAYPAPGRLQELQRDLPSLPEGPARRSLGAFLAEIGALSLGQWEELYTRTLDLNPPAAPYVGYQTWGESYQRGVFLAKLNRAACEAGVDTGGELADHLAPVLAYLAQTPEPLPELLEVLPPALARLVKTLRAADPANPYVKLFEAVQAACQLPQKEDA